MNTHRFLARLLPLVLSALFVAGTALAQFGRVDGLLRDHEGKPMADIVIVLKNQDTGQTFETKTDKNGRFVQVGLRSGLWVAICKIKGRYSNDYEHPFRMATAAEEKLDINLKDILAQLSAERSAEMKKQEEERSKFEGMKAHFDAGRMALEQARSARSEMMKLPVGERAPIAERMAQQATNAISELEAAERAAPDKDPNLHVVLSNLGEAYAVAGRFEEAAAAYTRAIELKPDNANYFLALGTAQASAGKATEAMATCDKAATLPAATVADAPQIAASCFGNVGIILQNTQKMRESIEPLKRAAQINPNNADYWFLLGRGLTNAMEYKMEGGTMKTIIQPGTAEAFAKYLELAPNGRFAQDAKESLAMLEQIAPGIQTKISAKKKKR